MLPGKSIYFQAVIVGKMDTANLWPAAMKVPTFGDSGASMPR